MALKEKNLATNDIDETLERSVDKIYPSKEELKKLLLSGRKIRVYLGIDPTGPHLHLGHLTNLLVLRRLQKLGHHIVLLMGDFTAMIGDPTDKTAARKVLTREEVLENLKTFKKQIEPIVEFAGKNAAEIRFNSEWLAKMKLEDWLKLSANFTVQQMMERDMFQERVRSSKPIGSHEFAYPLMQGYDSVALDVDLEIGGTDQTFNMLVGRRLMKIYKNKEKFVLTTKLLEHPRTGEKLMNKSEGGLINLDDPAAEIFGKVMALDDYSMFPVAEFCTEMDLARINELKESTASHELNPRNAKAEIAEEVVKTIYGAGDAQKAKLGFEKIFSKKDTASSDFPILPVDPMKERMLYDVIVKSGVVKTKSMAKILIKQGSIQQNGKQIGKNPLAGTQFLRDGDVLRIGKHHFFKVKI